LVQNASQIRSVLSAGVNGEACANFLGDVSEAVVFCCEFEVHASVFLIRGLVLDAKIGHGNLAAHDAEAMPLGDFRFGVARIALVFRPCQIAVEILLQLCVKDDPDVCASLVGDLFESPLVEPLKVCVVMGFAGLGEAVIEGLVLRSIFRSYQQTMALLGQCHKLTRGGFLVWDFPFSNEALPAKVGEVCLQVLGVPAVGKLS
jgi:hypothetical protein